jgi:hypothetical protein
MLGCLAFAAVVEVIDRQTDIRESYKLVSDCITENTTKQARISNSTTHDANQTRAVRLITATIKSE